MMPTIAKPCPRAGCGGSILALWGELACTMCGRAPKLFVDGPQSRQEAIPVGARGVDHPQGRAPTVEAAQARREREAMQRDLKARTP